MTTPHAYIQLRPAPEYRKDSFMKGCAALGYKPVDKVPSQFTPEDILVVWNRYGASNRFAEQFIKIGAKVLVAENCYLGNDFLGDKFYAISRDHHNGAGFWPKDDGRRWASFGYELAPYKEYDPRKRSLILPQRSIGEPGVAMPPTWINDLKRYKIPRQHVRRHPGQQEPIGKPLEKDLQMAHCAVTWGSGAAIKAMAWGTPVVTTWKDWIGAPGATYIKDVEDWDNVPHPDRLPMFERLAGAIWRTSEIESGEALERLLSCQS